MNRLFIVAILCGIITVGLSAVQNAHAQMSLPDEQVERIRQTCVTTQTSLSQLHASDGVIRVNLGKMYENMSNKLMAPLNSRIALNKLEGIQMAGTTLEYDRQVDVFRASYKLYEESMSRTIGMNCTDKPVEFYESIQATRQKREKLHQDTKTVTALLKDYRTQFEAFSAQFNRGDS